MSRGKSEGSLAARRRAGGDDRVAGVDAQVLADPVEDERVAADAVVEDADRGRVGLVDRADGARRGW